MIVVVLSEGQAAAASSSTCHRILALLATVAQIHGHIEGMIVVVLSEGQTAAASSSSGACHPVYAFAKSASISTLGMRTLRVLLARTRLGRLSRIETACARARRAHATAVAVLGCCLLSGYKGAGVPAEASGLGEHGQRVALAGGVDLATRLRREGPCCA